MKRFLILALLFHSVCFAQSWTGILAPARAINWGNAGLPATLPDGETTANPWTPPTRTQCGSTISSGASPASINAALAACSTGTYVLLGAGTFTFSSANLTLYAQNGVTLRGSGPQLTTLVLTGTAQIQFGSASFGTGFCTTWATGFVVGATSITVSGCSGTTPAAGELLYLSQCDSGYSGVVTNPLTVGTGCATGSSFDNTALYVCGNTTACVRSGEGTGIPSNQVQMVYLSSVTNTGGGTYTFTFPSPGLYMPNWGVTINSQYSTPYVAWEQGANTVTPYGNGLEDLTVYDIENVTTPAVSLSECYASWVKGVRFVATGSSSQNPEFVFEYLAAHNLIANNYSFSNISVTSSYEQNFEPSHESDDLVINNITESSVMWLGSGSMQDYVVAYNYAHNVFTQDTNGFFEHGPAGQFGLDEGNNVDSDEDDDTHGTHDLNTRFREYIRGWYDPYTSAPHPYGLNWGSGSHMENSIGNSIGNTGASSPLNVYSTTTLGVFNYVYGFGFNYSDPNIAITSLRWGNYDTATGAVRWCGNSSNTGWSTTCSSTSEIPTSLSGAQAPFDNSVPSTMNLPCSFFLAGYSSTTCSAHPSGGTGLSFWKVCKSWTTFPTSCATTSTPPFPPVGPDVTGGPYNAGTAYDIPSVVAQKNLPIDTTYQSSFTITASSWAGNLETLTVSGVPSANHLMGGFQLSGANASCVPTSGVSYTGRSDNEIVMTNSSVTTVVYSLPSVGSDPGCTGTLKFPDVRQFDERVYETDTASSNPVSGTPTMLLATPN